MNKTALITGATSGIGQAIARSFAKNSINLIICGRRKDRLAELKRELVQYVSVETLCFDVGNRKQVIQSLSQLKDSHKRIDILVNNAGGAHGLDLFVDGDSEDWDRMIDFNVKGLLYVSGEIIPWMVAQKQGHIINISSIAGK